MNSNPSQNQNSSTLPVTSATSSTPDTSGLREVSTEETHQVQLTEYLDASHSVTDAAPNASPDSLWKGTSPLADQGLTAVLSRSYQLGVFTWTTSARGTDIVPSMDVLATLLAIPNIAEKVAYFKYFRCKGVNLTIRVNATPWHYGTLVLSSTVNNSQDWHNSSNAASSQYFNNRPVLVDASSADAVNYEIHWKNLNQWYDTPASTPVNPMTFRMTVGVPLSMIGSVINPARVTVFANFIDPEVALPKGDSLATVIAQSGRIKKSKEARDKSTQGSVVSDISSFADTAFEVVSTISEVAQKWPLWLLLWLTSLRRSGRWITCPSFLERTCLDSMALIPP